MTQPSSLPPSNPLRLTPGAFWRDLRQGGSAFVVLPLAVVLLTIQEYIFLSPHFRVFFPDLTERLAPGVFYGNLAAAEASQGLTAHSAPWWGVLLPFVWWVGGGVLVGLVVPWVTASRLGFAPRELGLHPAGFLRKLHVYTLLLALGLTGVLWASREPRFLQIYPFLKRDQATDWCWLVLLLYWLLYAIQFFWVEFFFRGFLLFTLERRFGIAAIAVATVPYCMIHYHKPLPEALGAVVAGLVLGWLALKTRSIWGGVYIHVGVALSMDLLALARGSAGLPANFWP